MRPRAISWIAMGGDTVARTGGFERDGTGQGDDVESEGGDGRRENKN
jgi:hypothetical protein